MQRLEAGDIGRGVIYGAVIRVGVRATVRQGNERVPAGISKARANPAQAIAGYAVFQRAGRLGREILVTPTHPANGDQVDGRVGRGSGTQRRQEEWKEMFAGPDRIHT